MKKVKITDDTGNINGAARPNIKIAAYNKTFLFIILNTLFFLKV